ncbi:hypothetical protein [Methyloterricola oryzae]|uniref:hypothetical protein n=1 Tax=Methyloterricola oryzae TaxID=1495050 RepID=UPI00069AE54C|nr:hypothetical protein [Methyloterricola oryzae]
MFAPVLAMVDFADATSKRLQIERQARQAACALEARRRRWINLDFSGVSGVSWEFAQAFLRDVEQNLPTIWLVPKNYDQHCANLTRPLKTRLRRLREQEWIDGCERYSTGIDPRIKDSDFRR